MATTSLVRLGAGNLRVNPNEIRWNFHMKVNDAKTLGGKVIQINGMKVENLTVRGQYSPDRSKGDREAWEQQLRFREWVDQMTESVKQGNRTLKFAYPPRGWNFNVFISKFSGVNLTNEEIAQKWEIELFPVGDGSREIVQGVKDLYIKRLMNGIGWKQTDYNGPTQSEVDSVLAPSGGSVQDYLESRYEEAAYGDGATFGEPGQP